MTCVMNQVIKEISSKSREFYEFVLPPVDMYSTKDKLRIVVDMPGFAKNDIDLVLCGNVLSIKAIKSDEQSDTLILKQRPNIIDKKIRLPIHIKEGHEEIESAKYAEGILELVIPIEKKGKEITIE